MARSHRYRVSVRWTGNHGSGTSDQLAYSREHQVTAPGHPPIPGSADPAFLGEPDRWNPEELLVSALAQCHLLWYLQLATLAGVVVLDYQDDPEGTLRQQPGGGGQFDEVVLRPRVTVAAPGMSQAAQQLHERVAEVCFIARSVNFPVRCEPSVAVVAGESEVVL